MNLDPFTGSGSTPSRRRFWNQARNAVLASRKVAGRNVTVDEHPGKGTVINVADTSTRRHPVGGGSPGGAATGACCVGSVCSITTAADCASAGGIYQGDGTDCDPNPCLAGTIQIHAELSGSWGQCNPPGQEDCQGMAMSATCTGSSTRTGPPDSATCTAVITLTPPCGAFCPGTHHTSDIQWTATLSESGGSWSLQIVSGLVFPNQVCGFTAVIGTTSTDALGGDPTGVHTYSFNDDHNTDSLWGPTGCDGTFPTLHHDITVTIT